MKSNSRMIDTVLFCIIAYFIGSLSSAIIVCRLMGLPDPRSAGSKNPGTTNVLRIGNKKAAIITLLGDVVKGIIPVLCAVQLNTPPTTIGLVIISVFLGHLYPIFFRFQGGKGVATAIGAIVALNWVVGVMLIATWLTTVLCFRISSLGALIAALAAPFYTYWLCNHFVGPITIISVLLLWRHRTNIKRLWQGKEPKIGHKKQ
jgi:acyl phosphate:glycerol-3-phosphate acyltransferase